MFNYKCENQTISNKKDTFFKLNVYTLIRTYYVKNV